MEERHLPIYLLLDTSYSMLGEPIESVKQGVKQLLADLKTEPMAVETVWLSIIIFNTTALQVIPLTELIQIQEPPLVAQGSTSLGQALELLSQCIDREIKKPTDKQKGDWRPLIFLMTDGRPTDTWEPAADKLKKQIGNSIVACAAGPGADVQALLRITDKVVMLSSMQPESMKQFFEWVTRSIKDFAKSTPLPEQQRSVITGLPPLVIQVEPQCPP